MSRSKDNGGNVGNVENVENFGSRERSDGGVGFYRPASLGLRGQGRGGDCIFCSIGYGLAVACFKRRQASGEFGTKKANVSEGRSFWRSFREGSRGRTRVRERGKERESAVGTPSFIAGFKGIFLFVSHSRLRARLGDHHSFSMTLPAGRVWPTPAVAAA